jgi:hypothetical protein
VTAPLGIYSDRERHIILATTLGAIGRKWVVKEDCRQELVETIGWLESELEMALMMYLDSQHESRT